MAGLTHQRPRPVGRQTVETDSGRLRRRKPDAALLAGRASVVLAEVVHGPAQRPGAAAVRAADSEIVPPTVGANRQIVDAQSVQRLDSKKCNYNFFTDHNGRSL